MNVEPYLKKDIWQQEVSGWEIVDCAIRDRNIIYLCLRESVPHEQASMMLDSDIKTNFLAIYLHKPNGQYSATTLVDVYMPRVGAARKPKGQGLLVISNSDGQVFSMGAAGIAEEKIHPDGRPLTKRIKCIDGYAYSVGSYRKIYKRVDIGKWVSITEGIRTEEDISVQGFRDLDAFSEKDMYAVGGHGDVWHYDGKRWEQVGFPTNVQLGTVTCAGDGNVYIGGEGGSLWVGRDDTWRRVYQGGSSVLWNDTVWFQDKLWLASDYQARVWDGKEMRTIEHNGERMSLSGHMDAQDGLLVIASLFSVWGFDGRDWQLIVGPY